jgi:RecQ family ATP-dependent DNA helicase
MLWTDKAKKYLKKYWDITNLKEKQIEVINELLLGNDVIGLLPTGYGKSLCYLIPPLVAKKTIFIISPLISLMDDQIDKLHKMKIPCAALHSNCKNKDELVYKILDDEINIVYMSPEYLIKSDGFELARSLVSENKLGWLAVDESHCVSTWGQDFRPEYTKIKQFREEFKEIPILAVTATATTTVCQDICKMLRLNNPILVRASFDRPNLYMKILPIPTITVGKKNNQVPKEALVMNWIKKYPNDKIIVYVNSRKDSEELAFNINKIIKNCCDAYHAGLSKGLREQIQTKFIDGTTKIIISTIAFGMGIDQIVRVVIIFGAPSSIEEYYQQIGRGGRDGMHCDTILYFDYKNMVINQFMLREIKMKYPNLYKAKMASLNSVSKLVYTNTCRRKFVLEYFNESCDFFTCANCDNCCENTLIDITDKIWPIIMRPNAHLLSVVNEIRSKYLKATSGSSDKVKTVELDLMSPLFQWRLLIQKNKMTKDNIPDQLRIKIPSKFFKVTTSSSTNKLEQYDQFEEKISKYEKLLGY